MHKRTEREVEVIFKQIDVNSDGFLDREEFMLAVKLAGFLFVSLFLLSPSPPLFLSLPLSLPFLSVSTHISLSLSLSLSIHVYGLS